MIAAIIDTHVRCRRHMAINALRIVRAGMFGARELRRQVTLRTGVVRIRTRVQLTRMRIVAIAAGDSGRVHFALNERAVYVDLALDAAIGEIEMLVEE